MTPAVVEITQAVHVERYRIRLTFDDGTEHVLDFEHFLRNSTHPETRKWLAPDSFRTFRLEYGDLVWGDWELCFPIADLYEGCIEHSEGLEAAS